MYGLFHSQVLKLGSRRFTHDRLHAATQSSFACDGGMSGFVQRKPLCESTSCPTFELLDHRVGVREMVAENIGGLRGPRIHDQMLCRQCGELRALVAYQ